MTSPLRRNPNLIELNAWIFLARMQKKHGKDLTLLSIPDEEWKNYRQTGFDIVWLMGVWKRSPAARAHSLRDEGLKKVYDQLLPGWKEEDIAGSPYAIYDYSLDPKLGEREDLLRLRRKLNKIGLRIFLDYVPNHLALDHPLTEHPENFIQTSPETAAAHPQIFYQTSHGNFLAHGKDPHFAPWCDTVQINFFSKEARDFSLKSMLAIAEVSDGVRCDMAMLALNDVFQRTWGNYLSGRARPEQEFWTEIIEEIKESHPDFLFMAEAYWGTESELQRLGFDYTYDKKLYDLLLHKPAREIHDALTAPLNYQEHSVRFIENHDEERALHAFGYEKSRMAAMVIASTPGLRFFHDGQFEGKRKHFPVHLGKEPAEETNPEIEAFYDRLLLLFHEEQLHSGAWKLLRASQAWQGNQTFSNILVWTWRLKQNLRIIVLNYSPELSQARIQLPIDWLESESLTLKDECSGERFKRFTAEIRERGLYIELGPWTAHWFKTKLA